MMSFPVLDLGCTSPENYAINRPPSFKRTDTHDGRPRHRLYDTAPAYHVTLTLDLSVAQFAMWQSFWASLRGGADWFTMDLALRGAVEPCVCHAQSAYSAAQVPSGHWQVSLNVEAAPA